MASEGDCDVEEQKKRTVARWLQPRYVGMLCAIAVVQLTFPAAVVIIIRRQCVRWQAGRLKPTGIIFLFFRHLFRLGVTVEAYFFLYYLYQKRRLSELDVHMPPVKKGLGKRKEFLDRCLGNLDEVCCGKPWAPVQSRLVSRRAYASADALFETFASDKSLSARSVRRLQGPLGGVSGPSASSFLQGASSLATGLASGLRGQASSGSTQMPSMEDLLRWRSDGGFCNEGEDDEEEVMRLSMKRAELSSWFFKAPIQEITRGNIAEWLASHFFENSTPEALRRDPEQAGELEDLVGRIVTWAQLEDIVGGTEPNPEVRCMRLMRDPLPSAHRPFWLYLITHYLLPRVTRDKLERMGFRRYRAGAMMYWLRRGARARGDHADEERSPQLGSPLGATVAVPLVFCHGLGAGMLPYVSFVRHLAAEYPEADVFCVDMPHIQMRPREEVPSAREMCACVGDMLRAWGHSSAHLVGHSFGTIVCSWLVRYTPSMVVSASFVDPVCFLLVKSDLIFNALYNHKSSPFKDPGNWFLSFLIFRELYICHTLMRNFFWQQNNLWPDELHGFPSLVVLGGRDPLVPAHSVRLLFQAEKERRRLGAEAARSGGAVVIQSGHSPSAQDSNAPVLEEPTRVVFAPLAVHGQFWRDAAMEEHVLAEVRATIARGAELRARDRQVYG